MGLDGIHLRVPRELAEVLPKPLSIIYRKSQLTGQVPFDWKLANVTRIYKKYWKEDLGNCRPDLCGREDHGTDHLKYHHTAHSHSLSHRGLMKGRSCLTSFFFYDRVTSLVNEGKAVKFVKPDFKKAFDTISHNIVLEKVSVHGFNECALDKI